MDSVTDSLTHEKVLAFDYDVDVIVCGFGGAGGCAVDTSSNGASTLIQEGPLMAVAQQLYQVVKCTLEDLVHLQKACGFEDSTENMIAYIEASLEGGDSKKLNYMQKMPDHFEWIKSLGFPVKKLHLGRIVVQSRISFMYAMKSSSFLHFS